MAETKNKDDFKEIISPFLRKKMEELKNKYGENSKPYQFPEITVSLEKASIIFPNILITQHNDLINANNGYNSLELIDHKVSHYPITKRRLINF